MINKRADSENNSSHSRFGLDMHMTREIKGKGNYRIDGTLEGNLSTLGKVVLGKSGKLFGAICCAEADISGTVQGNIKVKGLLNLRATACIEGEVEMSKLVVEPGANLNAVCKMKKMNVKAPMAQDKKPMTAQ